MSDSPLPSPIQDHTIPQAPPVPQVQPSMGMTGLPGAGRAIDASRGYVGLGPRFAAGLIDALILVVPNALLVVATGGLGSIVLQWLYFAILHSGEKQATFGQRAMGIVITDMDGGRISFGKASGQYFGTLISGLILFIGYFMIAFTEKKQGLHDIMAGTLHYYSAD
jgi:uncharacterized RDD family membrane protein YckC